MAGITTVPLEVESAKEIFGCTPYLKKIAVMLVRCSASTPSQHLQKRTPSHNSREIENKARHDDGGDEEDDDVDDDGEFLFLKLT